MADRPRKVSVADLVLFIGLGIIAFFAWAHGAALPSQNAIPNAVETGEPSPFIGRARVPSPAADRASRTPSASRGRDASARPDRSTRSDTTTPADTSKPADASAPADTSARAGTANTSASPHTSPR